MHNQETIIDKKDEITEIDFEVIKRKNGAIPDSRVALALYTNQGLITYAAKSLGVTQSLISQRVRDSSYLQEVIQECIEARLDDAENGLSELVKDKSFAAINLTLRTVGKKRGYSESIAIDLPKETVEAHNRVMGELSKLQTAHSSALKIAVKSDTNL